MATQIFHFFWFSWIACCDALPRVSRRMKLAVIVLYILELLRGWIDDRFINPDSVCTNVLHICMHVSTNVLASYMHIHVSIFLQLHSVSWCVIPSNRSSCFESQNFRVAAAGAVAIFLLKQGMYLTVNYWRGEQPSFLIIFLRLQIDEVESVEVIRPVLLSPITKVVQLQRETPALVSVSGAARLTQVDPPIHIVRIHTDIADDTSLVVQTELVVSESVPVVPSVTAAAGVANTVHVTGELNIDVVASAAPQSGNEIAAENIPADPVPDQPMTARDSIPTDNSGSLTLHSRFRDEYVQTEYLNVEPLLGIVLTDGLFII